MKNESITYEYIKKLLLDALRELYANDYYYIENNVNERSISARLARYIEDKINTSDKVFGSFNIDCEYNRNMGDPKRGKLFNRIFGIDNKKNNPIMIPDIIVHRRGRNDANFLVIEVKKEGARFEGIEYDFQKLMYFTDSRGEYYYKYGFWIEIGLNSVNVVLFQEGNIVEKMSWKMSEGSNQKSNIIKKIIGY